MPWFVDSPEIESALKTSGLIQEHQIEYRPEKVSNAVLDKNVNVHLVRRYLTDDAWKLIEDVVKGRKTVLFGYARYAIMIFMAVNQSSQLFVICALNGIILAVLE